MVQALPYLIETASQTAGPYVHIGLAPAAAGLALRTQEKPNVLVAALTEGERIRIEGRVIDGAGAPLRDGLIELWQANAHGRYNHPADTQDKAARPGVPRLRPRGHRSRERAVLVRDHQAGAGARAARPPPMAPHVNLWIVARGINIGLNTRMYFDDEAAANAEDPVLRLIEPARAAPDPDRGARAARRRGGLPLRHPSPGRAGDGVLRCLSPCPASSRSRSPARCRPRPTTRRCRSRSRSRSNRPRPRSRPAPTLAHCHVRNDDQTPTSDPERFGRLLEGLRRHCPGMIVQFSTGGRSGSGRERGGMLPLAPDMASLATGSCNFPTRVYENSPELIEWLAAEMRAHRRQARDRGVRPLDDLQGGRDGRGRADRGARCTSSS